MQEGPAISLFSTRSKNACPSFIGASEMSAARKTVSLGGRPCVLHFLPAEEGATEKHQRRKRMKKIAVRAANGKYDVLCGRGMLRELPRVVSRIRQDGAVFVVSSPRVWRHWGARIEKLLAVARRATILIDDRETAKNLSTVERACRDLVRAGADRRALLVAVGGGVVGDVTGFVAASYARGIALIHVPTTVVAQVDSAIGGKTGVNLPEGKNLVGAFYPPKFVLADPELLSTLPPREFRSGIYEIIKYGVIGDAKVFEFLEQNLEKILRRERAALAFVIERSIAQKARVVSADERESGLREILNFGHTFAHALESVTRYRKYLHGEAVGWGMIAAARLAVEKGMFSPLDEERVAKVIAGVGPLPAWPSIAPARLIAAMQADKKTRAGRLRFVLPERIGQVRCGVHAEEEMLVRVLRECAIAAVQLETRKSHRQ
jgi:3-dehydroquinate synthase